MMMINALNHVQLLQKQSIADDIIPLAEIAKNTGETKNNLGFDIMYEAWKLSILLSDGTNDEENFDW